MKGQNVPDNHLSVADFKAAIAKKHAADSHTPDWVIGADAEMVQMVADGLAVAWLNDDGQIMLKLTEAGWAMTEGEQ